jgi:hypothetical protein
VAVMGHQILKVRYGDIGRINPYSDVEFKLRLYEDIGTQRLFLQNRG